MSADAGRTLGKYHLIAEIARGGMGIVYLAQVHGPGGFHKLVVVKELKPELVEEPAFLTMFLDEARLAARLNHPNIVQTNEVGNDGDRYFMAMDYLDGRGLDRVRRRSRSNPGLSLPMHLRVLCDALAGLEYAHSLTDFDGTPLHIVHRDVSPQNVFVTFDGQVKLLDFGIAKARDSMHETHAGVLKGKVSYMAPEQARGQRVDARADVFSAGVMLWEALTGKKLREGQNGQEMLWALASGDLPRPSTVRPSIPAELDKICARAIAWDREQRYPTAGALHDDLERFLANSGLGVTARELGQSVSEMFREDRAATSALIEAHVARARGEAARGALPIIDVASMPPTPSGRPGRPTGPYGVTASAVMGAPESTVFEPALVGAAPIPMPMPAAPGSMPVSLPGSSPGSSPGALGSAPGHTGIGTQTAPSVAGAAGAGRTRSGARALRIAIPAITAVSIIALVLVARSGDVPEADRTAAPAPAPATPTPSPSRSEQPVPAPAPSPAPPVARTDELAPAPAPAPRAGLIDVTITVTPAHARVTIDDAEVAGNPVRAKYQLDAAMHHIRATAPGYQPKAKAVPFDEDVALELHLEKVVATRPAPAPSTASRERTRPRAIEPASAPPPAAADPAPPAASAAAPEVSPAGGTKPRRPIDTSISTEVNPAGGTKPRRPIDSNNPYDAE